MKILLIKTDQPEAEIILYDDNTKLAEIKWLAHRQLAETIHLQIKKLLADQDLSLADMNAIGAFQGPGSFTGLRIGISVANALAHSLDVPIATSTGDDWEHRTIEQLLNGENTGLISPDYGAEPHTTKQKR